MYVHTYERHDRLLDSIVAVGCTVTREGIEGGSNVVIVKGTGWLKWPHVDVAVGENQIVANGVEVASRPDGYRNLVIDKNGHVEPDSFLPFERHFP